MASESNIIDERNRYVWHMLKAYSTPCVDSMKRVVDRPSAVKMLVDIFQMDGLEIVEVIEQYENEPFWQERRTQKPHYG